VYTLKFKVYLWVLVLILYRTLTNGKKPSKLYGTRIFTSLAHLPQH